MKSAGPARRSALVLKRRRSAPLLAFPPRPGPSSTARPTPSEFGHFFLHCAVDDRARPSAARARPRVTVGLFPRTRGGPNTARDQADQLSRLLRLTRRPKLKLTQTSRSEGLTRTNVRVYHGNLHQPWSKEGTIG